MAQVYLGLGSNLGERAQALQQAADRLAQLGANLRLSAIYETEPWGYADQPAFLNQCATLTTELPPDELLVAVKQIEQELGREPTFRYGPRQIDIDVLLYDDLTLDTPPLVIPHPRLHERAFVLVPLAELAGEVNHPVLEQTIAELLAAVDTAGVKRWQPVKTKLKDK